MITTTMMLLPMVPLLVMITTMMMLLPLPSMELLLMMAMAPPQMKLPLPMRPEMPEADSVADAQGPLAVRPSRTTDDLSPPQDQATTDVLPAALLPAANSSSPE